MNDDPQAQQGEGEAAEVLARDKRYVWHPYTQHGTEGDPIVIARAKAASLFDSGGREILDLIASWWTCTHGHSHPKLNAALAAQASRFEHVMFAGFTHEPAADLAASLAKILPAISTRSSSPTTARPRSRSRSRSPINIGSIATSRAGRA